MGHKEDIIHGMEETFENNVDIADEYEYISTDELYEEIGLELEGWAFSSSKYLVFVDKRSLPELFSIIVMQREVGEIASHTTHKSIEAAAIASKMMQKYDY